MDARRGVPGVSAWALGSAIFAAACGGGGTEPGSNDVPTVLSTTPFNGATGVPVTSTVTAVFSTNMDQATINTTSFTVGGVTGTVSGTLNGATFTPTTNLAPSTTYTATIASSVTDASGNPLAGDYSWSFTTGTPPVPVAEVPLVAGRTWIYDEEWSRTVVGSTIGVQNTTFDGTVVLHVEGPVSWEGRSAHRLLRFDVESAPDEQPFRAEVLYVFQSADGLETWVPTASGGEWRRILSRSALSFSTNHLLLAGDPRGPTTTIAGSSVVVPAGSYTTVRARVQFTQSGQFEPEDIFEDRSEHYVDDVGPVAANWNFDFDDNDPSAFDVVESGSIMLNRIDAGLYSDPSAEGETNNSAGEARAIPKQGIVYGRVAVADPGTIVTHIDVFPNILGSKLLQDWFRFSMPSTGAFRVDLVYQTFTGAQANDVDVYLFREEAGGVLTYVAASVEPEAEAEVISIPSLAAGTYLIAVQGWNTPSGAIDYWFVTR